MTLTFYEWLAVVGLALDIFGAIYMAKGFMAKKLTDIEKESGTYWGSNTHLRDSLIYQRIEAQIGGVFLFTGFSLQILSYLLKLKSGIYIYFIILAVLLMLYSIANGIVRNLAGNTIRGLLFNEQDKKEA